jgi:hypothetical protein
VPVKVTGSFCQVQLWRSGSMRSCPHSIASHGRSSLVRAATGRAGGISEADAANVVEEMVMLWSLIHAIGARARAAEVTMIWSVPISGQRACLGTLFKRNS